MSGPLHGCAARSIVLLLAGFIGGSAIAMDLGEIARSMRNANEISRQGKNIYDRVQSISKPTTAKRRDSLPPDGQNVIFYSASWCGYCNRARDYMNANGVAFVEYDTEKSAKGRADYETLQARGVPILLIGDERMNGWNESRFERMYEDFRRSGATPAVTPPPPANDTVVQTPPPAATPAPVALEPPSIATGTVLAAKIDNVAVFSASDRDSKVVARLKKGEEVVATDGKVGDLVAVETAAGGGWVDARLFKME